MDAARVNLTLPRPVDDLVAELAAVTGQSKSSVIASYLVWQLPQLRAWLDAYQGRRASPSAPTGDLPRSPMPPARQVSDRHDGLAQFSTPERRDEELTRQQRRALERESRKVEKAARRGKHT